MGPGESQPYLRKSICTRQMVSMNWSRIPPVSQPKKIIFERNNDYQRSDVVAARYLEGRFFPAQARNVSAGLLVDHQLGGQDDQLRRVPSEKGCTYDHEATEQADV